MHGASGGCHCGNVLVELELSRAPGTYHPRACDCDFCRKHGAAYLSDPQGSLLIRIKDERRSGSYRQGSGTAEFLLCKDCGVLVGVLYRSDAGIHGAVNARAIDRIDGQASFGPEQPVSPRTLAAGDKVKRWRDVWFPGVRVVTGET